MSPNLSDAAASAAADAVCALLDGGYLKIYDGTMPASADTATTTQEFLAELRWNVRAFRGAAKGLALANPLRQDVPVAATGTARWFRAVKADGVTPVFDGTVGKTGATLNLKSVALSEGAEIVVTDFSYQQVKVR